MPASRKDEAVGVGGTGASEWSEPTKESNMDLRDFIPEARGPGVPDDEDDPILQPEPEESILDADIDPDAAADALAAAGYSELTGGPDEDEIEQKVSSISTRDELEDLIAAAEIQRAAGHIAAKRRRGRPKGRSDNFPRNMLKNLSIPKVTDRDLQSIPSIDEFTGDEIIGDLDQSAGDASLDRIARQQVGSGETDAARSLKPLRSYEIQHLLQKQAAAAKRSRSPSQFHPYGPVSPEVYGMRPDPNAGSAEWPDYNRPVNYDRFGREITFDPSKRGFVPDETGPGLSPDEQAYLNKYYYDEWKRDQDERENELKLMALKKPVDRGPLPPAGKYVSLKNTSEMDRVFPTAWEKFSRSGHDPRAGSFVLVDADFKKPSLPDGVDPERPDWNSKPWQQYWYRLGMYLDSERLRKAGHDTGLFFLPRNPAGSHLWFDPLADDYDTPEGDDQFVDSGGWVSLGPVHERQVQVADEQPKKDEPKKQRSHVTEDDLDDLIRYFSQDTGVDPDKYDVQDVEQQVGPTPPEEDLENYEVVDFPGGEKRYFDKRRKRFWGHRPGIPKSSFNRLTSPGGMEQFRQRRENPVEDLNDLREQIEMELFNFFNLNEAHGENAEKLGHDVPYPDNRPEMDPTGMDGFEGGMPEDEMSFRGPNLEDPTSSRDNPLHDDLPNAQGGSLDAPPGVFQGGEMDDGFGAMEEPYEDTDTMGMEGDDPMPGSPDDEEVAGAVGDPGFGAEEDDWGRTHQTGEGGPEHRTNVRFPEYEEDRPRWAGGRGK